MVTYRNLFFLTISIAILFLTINLLSNIMEDSYSQGVQDGQLNLISQIQQTQQIPYFTNETGDLTIKIITIQELCMGMQNG